MAVSIRIETEAQKTLAFGSIVAGYTAVGTALVKPARIILVQNLTDASLQFSFNGTDDHFPLPTNGFLLLDVTANNTDDSQFVFPIGQLLYVKRIGTPTSGSVYFSSWYGDKD